MPGRQGGYRGSLSTTRFHIREEQMSVRQKKLELIEAMNRARAMEPSSFVPNKLLDTLIERMNLKNDAELCRVLEVQPPIISKIRHRKLAVGATILLRMHEKSDMSIRELKELSTASVH
jgi:plasmid maintenance system antidote protein VapI